MTASGQIEKRPTVAFVLRNLTPYRVPFLRRFIEANPDLNVAVIAGEGVEEAGKLGAGDGVGTLSPIFVRGHVWEFWKYTLVWLEGCLTQLRAINAQVVVLEGNFGILSQTFIALWARLTGRRIIFWVAGWTKPWVNGAALALRESFMRVVLPLGHRYICYSSAAADMLRRLGVKGERIAIAQNTIDTERIATSAAATERAATVLRRHLRVADNPVLVYVGALAPGKRVERVLEMHKSLLNRGVPVETIIVGDGPSMKSLQDIAQAMPRVHFVGRVVEEVDAYFALGNVFVLPALGGLAINQAMANARPVICTLADGTERDLVVDDVTGYLRPSFDAEQWADLAEHLFANPELANEMGSRGRTRVLQIATLEKMCVVFRSTVTEVLPRYSKEPR